MQRVLSEQYRSELVMLGLAEASFHKAFCKRVGVERVNVSN